MSTPPRPRHELKPILSFPVAEPGTEKVNEGGAAAATCSSRCPFPHRQTLPGHRGVCGPTRTAHGGGTHSCFPGVVSAKNSKPGRISCVCMYTPRPSFAQAAGANPGVDTLCSTVIHTESGSCGLQRPLFHSVYASPPPAAARPPPSDRRTAFVAGSPPLTGRRRRHVPHPGAGDARGNVDVGDDSEIGPPKVPRTVNRVRGPDESVHPIGTTFTSSPASSRGY